MAASDASPGRIRFPGNPWPDGHAIETVTWSGRLLATGELWFDLHLTSADYYAEDEDDDEEEDADDDWTSKGCWSNYHACILSSTYWDEEGTGILAGTPQEPLSFARLDGRIFEVDALPMEGDPAFHVYLMGHDSVADHRIAFRSGARPSDAFALAWSGKVALTYAGDEEFRYTFEASVPSVRFDGIYLGGGVLDEAAAMLLGRSLVEAERFELVEREGRRVFVCG